MVSEGLDRELSPADQARLRAHFSICGGCRSIRERMEFLRRALRRFVTTDANDKP